MRLEFLELGELGIAVPGLLELLPLGGYQRLVLAGELKGGRLGMSNIMEMSIMQRIHWHKKWSIDVSSIGETDLLRT